MYRSNKLLLEDFSFVSENEDILSEMFTLNENFLMDLKDKIFKKQKKLKDAVKNKDIKKIHNITASIVPNDKKSTRSAKELFKRSGGGKVKKAQKISKDLQDKGLNKSMADTVGMTASLTGRVPSASKNDFKDPPGTIRWLTGWVLFIAGIFALSASSLPLLSYIVLSVALISLTNYISYGSAAII